MGALLGGASPVTHAPTPGPLSTAPAPAPAPAPGTGPGLAPAAGPDAAPVPDARDLVRRVPLRDIHPCPFQPRKDFSEESLRELADSIREQGIVQPLVVRRRDGRFELIAGERRWRAAQLLQLAEVPVLVREADDGVALELALIENLQREDLNPLEEAQGYAQLIERFALRQEDVATRVGKSRVAVANALRLLKLPTDLQAHVRQGRLSVGHAKVILGLNDPALQALAAERILKEGLNVRQTEALVGRLSSAPPPPAAGQGAKAALPRDVHVAALERKLEERLGTKVRVHYRAGQGRLEVRFFSDHDLERVLQLLGVAPD